MFIVLVILDSLFVLNDLPVEFINDGIHRLIQIFVMSLSK
jgi:hypothetical protein